MPKKSKNKVKPGKARDMRSSAPGSPSVETPGAAASRWSVFGVCIFLAVITFAVFGQTVHDEFVNFDDDLYVYNDPQVARGLTLDGIAHVFIHGSGYDNWDPLTAMSHMLDCQLYGLNPGAHHLTNILLHAATAILLFLVLRQMTGFLWRSAFVAAVFAIHPLRVESVAWISERKDVLSGMFFMLTLWAYVRYARHSWSPARYGLVVFLAALGLVSKPMLVTLPFVLLLLDYWPLKRFGTTTISRLIVEKIPLLGLSIALCVATVLVERMDMQPLEMYPLPLRIGNVLVSYVTYLGQMIYPVGLAVLYPYPARGLPVWEIIAAILVLVSISAGVFIWRRTRPYLLVGWLWYLIMLVPVIGLVQVGLQARADRHTYLPQIGLYVLLTWVAADLCVGWRHRRVVLGGGSAIILMALIFCAYQQTSYWKNSESLWTHTLACTSDNAVAHYTLGDALFDKGNLNDAIAQYQMALQINPNYLKAHNNLGAALLQQGNISEAIVHFRAVVQAEPGFPGGLFNLADAQLQEGNADEAITNFQKGLQIKPGDAQAENDLGYALIRNNQAADAILHFEKALQIKPDFAEAHNNLGAALLQKHDLPGAIIQFQDALQSKPDFADAQKNLAWVLATSPQASLRNGPQAVDLAQRANQLTGDVNPIYLDTLSAAYAEAGRFSEAIETARRALQQAGSNAALANVLRLQINLYQGGNAYHVQ